MMQLQSSYASDDEDETIDETIPVKVDVIPEATVKALVPMNAVDLSPPVDELHVVPHKIDANKQTQLFYNAKFEELYAPIASARPKPGTERRSVRKNFLTGNVEEAFVNDFHFESQRREFHLRGKALDPSDGASNKDIVIRNKASLQLTSDPIKEPGTSMLPMSKRKREKNDDSTDIDNYQGPWAPYQDEVNICRPSEEDAAEIAEYMTKKKKRANVKDDNPIEEKITLHINDPYDYQGRSFLHPPHDLDVSLKADSVPSRCFLPKKPIHTYVGHTKTVSAIRGFPRSAHLFLSCGMDAKIKLWEMYNERRCILTYLGHKQAVRDVCFNRNGDRFVSAGYDRYLKLWDDETGQCIKRFTNKKVAFCLQFNPDEEKSHLFLSGMSDTKILCWDTRTGKIEQKYDRHLGAINTITFVDSNHRFVSTSDNKSVRVWEWDIPVDIKYIADPGLHSMPAVAIAPNGKWLAFQSMDNKIRAFACLNNRFKLNSKKIFTGHMVAGYACSPDFSPDMSYLVSRDGDGKVFIWDWKTTKVLKKFQAHENVCISTLWHPPETSKILSAGWDSKIHLWD